jgi:argininosuccinate synthase
VRVRLYKGSAVVEGMKSKSAIYRYDLATYSDGDAFDHTSAAGFIKVWGLPIKTWTQTHAKDDMSYEKALELKLNPDKVVITSAS